METIPMKTKEQVKAVGDLVKVLNEVENVLADKVNSHLRSRYASLGAILDHVRPVLAKHGLANTFRHESHDKRLRVYQEFIHENGTILSELLKPNFTDISTEEKMTAQQLQSNCTYAAKLLICRACSIATDTDVDDDGHTASHHAPSNPQMATPAQKPGNLIGTTPTQPRTTPYPKNVL